MSDLLSALAIFISGMAVGGHIFLMLDTRATMKRIEKTGGAS